MHFVSSIGKLPQAVMVRRMLWHAEPWVQVTSKGLTGEFWNSIWGCRDASSIKVAVVQRPVRGQFQHSRTEMGNRKASQSTDRTDEQMLDDEQQGKIAGKTGHFRESHVRVALGTGGISAGIGKSWSIRMTWQAIQEGVRWPLQNMVKTVQHPQEWPAGTAVNGLGRVFVSCTPKSHRD
jgi:hypothetical protein